MSSYSAVLNAGAAILLCFGTISAHASCTSVPVELFGFSLGPAVGYPDNLAPGIEREGSAELIRDVGFESLQGTTKDIAFDRIMVFVDRGAFIGFEAIGQARDDSDLGFSRVVRLVEASSGLRTSRKGAEATLDCGNRAELSVSRMTWDDGKPRVRISYQDQEASERMRAYIRDYCADPARRRPQDACR